MRQLPSLARKLSGAISLQCMLPGILLLALVLACGPAAPATPPAGEITGYANQVADALILIRQAHRRADDPAQAGLAPGELTDRYRAIDEELRSKIQQLEDLTVPDDFRAEHQDLLRLLDQERGIWVHLGLYATTGQELHRVLANELMFEVDGASRALAQRVNGTLADRNVGPVNYLEALSVVSVPTAVISAGMPTAAPTVPVATAAPTPTRATVPAATPTPDRTPAATATASLPTPTSPPTATAAPIPTATPTLAPRPTRTPTPGPPPPPGLTLQNGTGDFYVFRWVDRRGDDVLVAHWAIDVGPGAHTVADYPFVAGDKLDIQVWGDVVNSVYLLDPEDDLVFRQDQNNLTPLGDIGEVVAPREGNYHVHIDNSGSNEPREVHLTINYHTPAPGSILLQEDEEGLAFRYP